MFPELGGGATQRLQGPSRSKAPSAAKAAKGETRTKEKGKEKGPSIPAVKFSSQLTGRVLEARHAAARKAQELLNDARKAATKRGVKKELSGDALKEYVHEEVRAEYQLVQVIGEVNRRLPASSRTPETPKDLTTAASRVGELYQWANAEFRPALELVPTEQAEKLEQTWRSTPAQILVSYHQNPADTLKALDKSDAQLLSNLNLGQKAKASVEAMVIPPTTVGPFADYLEEFSTLPLGNGCAARAEAH
jgi:hypothetical protein